MVAAYTVVLVGYPAIAPLAALIGMSSRVVTIPYRGVVAAISLALVLVGIASRRFYHGLLLFPLAAFWVLYMARLILDTLAAPIPLRMSLGEYYMFTIGTVLLPLMAFLVVPTTRALEWARQWILMVGAAACVANLLLAAAALPLSRLGLGSVRLSIETLNPISLGHTGVMTAILAAFELLRSESVAKRRFLAIAALGAGIVAMIASGSRGPVFALLFAMAFLMLVGWRLGSRTRVVVALGTAAAMGAFLFFKVEGLARAAAAFRFGGITGTMYDPSVNVRLALFEEGLRLFAENPVTGAAIELPGSGYYPHNIIIEALMATGVIGGVMFLLAFAGAAFAAVRLAIVAPLYAWLGALLVQQMVAVQFSGAIAGSPEVWALMGCAIAVHGQLSNWANRGGALAKVASS